MLELLNITKYFDAVGIDYKTHGKNISRGWIGLKCPFCPDPDPSYHLGIRLSDKFMKCWRCGKKSTALHFIHHIESCSWDKVHQITEQYSDLSLAHTLAYSPKIPRGMSGYVLPGQATTQLSSSAKKFLKSRRFNPQKIAEKYDLHCCGPLGDFKHRLIIPIKIRKQIVSFVGRDPTGLSDVPYKDCPIEQAIIAPKETLYNFDSLIGKDSVIIVEGILDAWRLGDGAVATLGVNYSSNQINMLRGLKRAFIMYDDDAKSKAEQLAADVSNIIANVKILELDQGDPCDLSDKDVNYVRELVFGRIT